MKFASLGSGSKGNATLVEDGHSSLLIDCGFSVKETERRLSRLGRSAEDLSGILVTHEHGDHIRGVLPLARKYCLPVYMTAGTANTLKSPHHKLKIIDSHNSFQCASMTVIPVAVPHDAREPVQYLVNDGRHTLGVLTDLGHISSHVAEQYANCDGLLLEANHDHAMVSNGPYHPRLKQRVGGDWGHLSNTQSRELLEHVALGRLQHLVLAHISEQNNHPEKVQEAVAGLEKQVAALHIACQSEGFGWLSLE